MRAVTDRVHAGDLDGLASLYGPMAVFEPRPGRLRQARAELLARQDRLSATFDWRSDSRRPGLVSSCS
jgi:hypothetical protein